MISDQWNKEPEDREKNLWFTELLAALHKDGRLAWFFDLDGTLTRATPGVHTNVTPDEELQTILNSLHQQSGAATAVITGRPDIFVSGLLPERRFPSATEHGAVISENSGSGIALRCASYDFAEIKAIVERQIADIENCYVEDHKRTTLTIQFSEAADPEGLAPRLVNILQEIADSPDRNHPEDPLIVIAGNVKGNHVIDLIPRSADKAEAVKHFMATNSFSGKIAVFCGDSAADEPAMLLCKRHGGIAIGVGPSAPACSDIVFADIYEMRNFLAEVISLHNGHRNAHNPDRQP